MRNVDPIEQVRLELVTRKFMVTMLAVIGVWVGIAMILTGAPSFIETWFSPWSRYLVGGFAFGFGLITSIGAVIGDERLSGWWAQVVGLVGMVAWYVAMGGAYALLVTVEGWAIVGPGEALDPDSSGRGYVPLVYLGLVIMTLTPLTAMLRLGRPARRPDELSFSRRRGRGSAR